MGVHETTVLVLKHVLRSIISDLTGLLYSLQHAAQTTTIGKLAYKLSKEGAKVRHAPTIFECARLLVSWGAGMATHGVVVAGHNLGLRSSSPMLQSHVVPVR